MTLRQLRWVKSNWNFSGTLNLDLCGTRKCDFGGALHVNIMGLWDDWAISVCKEQFGLSET